MQPRAEGLGRDDLLAQPELLHERAHGGAADGERLGAAVEFEGLGLGGPGLAVRGDVEEARGDRAPEHGGGLGEGHVPARRGQSVGRDEAGDAAADHERRAAHARSSRSAVSTPGAGSWPSRSGTGREWISSTTRVSTAASVSGGTPWARLTT